MYKAELSETSLRHDDSQDATLDSPVIDKDIDAGFDGCQEIRLCTDEQMAHSARGASDMSSPLMSVATQEPDVADSAPGENDGNGTCGSPKGDKLTAGNHHQSEDLFGPDDCYSRRPPGGDGSGRSSPNGSVSEGNNDDDVSLGGPKCVNHAAQGVNVGDHQFDDAEEDEVVTEVPNNRSTPIDVIKSMGVKSSHLRCHGCGERNLVDFTLCKACKVARYCSECVEEQLPRHYQRCQFRDSDPRN